jgi:hypothetical protein
MIFLVLILVSIVLILNAIATDTQGRRPRVCLDENRFSDFVDVTNRYIDVNNVALNTHKNALTPVITDLQAIRNEAQTLDLPECASEIKDYLLEYMDSTIDGYLAFHSGYNAELYFRDAREIWKKLEYSFGELTRATTLESGKIKKSEGELEFSVAPEIIDSNRVRFVLTNNSDKTAFYITVGIAHKKADGEIKQLREDFFYSIVPSDQGYIDYHRSLKEFVTGVDVEELIITINEAYYVVDNP